MPLKRAAYKAATKTVSIPFGEDSLSVCYYPSKFTPNVTKDKDRDETTVAFLLRLVASWDYLDEKDKPLPVTEETLSDMGYDLLNAISRAIVGDVSPKQEAS